MVCEFGAETTRAMAMHFVDAGHAEFKDERGVVQIFRRVLDKEDADVVLTMVD